MNRAKPSECGRCRSSRIEVMRCNFSGIRENAFVCQNCAWTLRDSDPPTSEDLADSDAADDMENE